MNRPGAGPQALRNIPGNVFQNQPTSGPRPAALGSGRLQNGKLGSGSGWAFGGGMSAAGTPQNPQARPTPTSMTSFAQTIGGAQNQASLDLSICTPFSLAMGGKKKQKPKWKPLDWHYNPRPSSRLSTDNDSDIGAAASTSASASTTAQHSKDPSANDIPLDPDATHSHTRVKSYAEAVGDTQPPPGAAQPDKAAGTAAAAAAAAAVTEAAATAAAPRVSEPDPRPCVPNDDSLHYFPWHASLKNGKIKELDHELPSQSPLPNPVIPLDVSSDNNVPTLTTDREFPSLSGAPQSQQQNPSAIWSNPNIRASAAQRQQSQTPSHAQQSSQASHSQLGQRSDQQDSQPGTFPPLGNGASGVDDLRFDERLPIGMSSRASGQQGSADDFPPLGGLGDNDLRQTTSNQSRFNGTGNALYGAQQQSSRPFGQGDGHLDGLASPSGGASLSSPSNLNSAGTIANRSLAEASFDDQAAFPPRSGLSTGGRIQQGPAQDTFSLPHRGPPQNQQSQPSGQAQGTDSASAMPSDAATNELQQMSELDRYGLKGFMTQLRTGSQDQLGLMLGMDLNSLGLDLHRQGPLWQDWAGPFASPRSQPIIPDYRLPAAYTVHNVPPLHTKISSFSDETLFAIFYGVPRDVSQELAAIELYSRDWRWHKKMQQWMMKAKEYGDPVQLPSNKEERGWYYFFDVHNWRRERKEFILNYEHLYHGHAVAAQPPMPMS